MSLLEAFIARWQGQEGGAERADYALFLAELCDVLAVPRPHPASAARENNDYVFERAVVPREGGERSANKRIDLYKKNCFILEAKQSRWKGGDKAIAGQEELFAASEQKNAGRRGTLIEGIRLKRSASTATQRPDPVQSQGAPCLTPPMRNTSKERVWLLPAAG